jgi:putative membrane protein insertion efficiency factor
MTASQLQKDRQNDPGLTCHDPADGPNAEAGTSSNWVVMAIRGYQVARAGRPTGCRFIPTCSEYTAQAIERHGMIRGVALGVRRLARCTPWGGQGFDPVPEGRASCSDH